MPLGLECSIHVERRAVNIWVDLISCLPDCHILPTGFVGDIRPIL